MEWHYKLLSTQVGVIYISCHFRSIFKVDAVDEDLEGTIVYQLVGDFPVQSFIDVDSSTGEVNLRYSLLADSTQNSVYTVSTYLLRLS